MFAVNHSVLACGPSMMWSQDAQKSLSAPGKTESQPGCDVLDMEPVPQAPDLTQMGSLGEQSQAHFAFTSAF